jgi:glycosyltransferase involved in cell wall biosynthesis
LQRAAFNRSPVRIAYIGRLSEEKGLPAFLEAVEVVASQQAHAKLRFEIVGDGPLRARAQDAARRHPGLLEFVGPLSNEAVVPYLETIDAGVCLTHCGEGGGGGVSNGLLEIIAARRLVIAWDSVIFTQVLKPDQACLVEEGQVDRLAQALLHLSAHPEEATVRILASEPALRPYTLDEHVAHLMRFLES